MVISIWSGKKVVNLPKVLNMIQSAIPQLWLNKLCLWILHFKSEISILLRNMYVLFLFVDNTLSFRCLGENNRLIECYSASMELIIREYLNSPEK